jgi:SAM-dependent methyltransferase
MDREFHSHVARPSSAGIESSWVVDRLTRSLEAVEVQGWHGSYILRMWREALREAGRPVASEVPSLSFPYVPFAPEDLGVELTTTSAVIDIGCLGGFGLFDFARRRKIARRPTPRLFGLDIDDESVSVGRQLASVWAPGHPVFFQRGSCEALPYQPASFDLLIARAVLPYAGLNASVAEFARVVRPGGLALVQVHAPGYYVKKLFRNLKRPRKAGYYARPILSGMLFAVASYQPAHPWFRETALDLASLIGLGARHGLHAVWCRPSWNRPVVMFRRRALRQLSAPRA